jgi:hypothetical protein
MKRHIVTLSYGNYTGRNDSGITEMRYQVYAPDANSAYLRACEMAYTLWHPLMGKDVPEPSSFHVFAL